jgi:hypothetical protein
MSTIIPFPAREAHPDRDAEARNRTHRLNRATAEDMHTALAFLNAIDPEAFEIAFQAVPSTPDAQPDWDGLDDPEPVCGHCGAPVALVPDQGMTWHHFRGPVNPTSGPQEIYNPGHDPKVEWYLPDEIPVDF